MWLWAACATIPAATTPVSTTPSDTTTTAPSSPPADTAAPELDCRTLGDLLAADWEVLIESSRSCDTTEDCHAPFGACELLGTGCQEAVNVALTAEALADWRAEATASLEQAGCEVTTHTCDCYGGFTAECASGRCAIVYGPL